LLFLLVFVSGAGPCFLHPTYINTRIALPLTTLICSIILHQSYTDSLPHVGYMVLIDKIYILSYLLIILAIFTSLYLAKKAHIKDVNLDNKDDLLIHVGKSDILLKKSGEITIKGKSVNGISIKGSGDVILKGSKISEN